ncbi:hypothetical protein [Nostoc sp. 2RC]|uniref:hypothetical protein n=1 Tax=Nostoc sp. 2RC TaxID=2485484 RepID=UPI00162A3CA4|nr:hypothetical protein [Nostoc sp. 2RC]MBC1237146.1 hypothetical protein [Nostoc sp. 2RC]
MVVSIVAQKAMAIATISQLSKAIACRFTISSGAIAVHYQQKHKSDRTSFYNLGGAMSSTGYTYAI